MCGLLAIGMRIGAYAQQLHELKCVMGQIIGNTRHAQRRLSSQTHPSFFFFFWTAPGFAAVRNGGTTHFKRKKKEKIEPEPAE